MKKISGLLILLALSLFACKDDSKVVITPEPAAKTKTQLLTEAEWQLMEGTITPSITVEIVPGTNLTVNNYWDLLGFAGGGQVLECDKNNLMICNKDSSVVLDEGPTKCDAADPQTTDGGKWFFESSESKINFSSFPMDPTGEPRVLNVDLLTSSDMTLTMTYDFKDPVSGGTTVHDIILKYKNVK